MRYLTGSCGAAHHIDPPGNKVVSMEDLATDLAQPDKPGSVRAMELFGGESGVGKRRVRRRFARGENFDLVIGFELTDVKHQQEVVKYINRFRPLVVVMRPPLAQDSGIGATSTCTSTQTLGASHVGFAGAWRVRSSRVQVAAKG